MMTRYHRAFCAALLAVVLFLTAAGCAAEKPAASAPEQFPEQAIVGPVRLGGPVFPMAPSDDAEDGGDGTQGPGKAEPPEADGAETPGVDGTETPGADGAETPGLGKAETPGAGVDETRDTEPAPAAGSGSSVPPVALAAGGAVAAALIEGIIIAVLLSKKNNAVGTRQLSSAAGIGEAAPRRNERAGVQKASGMIQIGKLHNIGRRSAQQDSLGSMVLDGGSGAFAVVADGMGGLSGGDQVSQSIVMSMLQRAGSLGPGQMDGELNAMVRSASEEVNRKLGADGIYRSGSTVVAVLLRGNVLHWISVGDSRIYLCRGGGMIQLNHEHTYAVELMQRVTNGEITAAEAASDPQRHGLTSFIGMGKLKYVDASMRPIVLQGGDRIVLMSDGVFNNLPEFAMADIIQRNPDVQQAAKVLEEQVLALQDPAQDNFTAIILGF